MSNDLLCDIFKTIFESILLVEERFLNIKQPVDFVSAPQGVILLDAINMRLQTIGEQLGKIYKTNPQFLDNYPSIEWKNIIDLRNIISHHYEKVDYEIIFEICKEHIPILKKEIGKILFELKCA